MAEFYCDENANYVAVIPFVGTAETTISGQSRRQPSRGFKTKYTLVPITHIQNTEKSREETAVSFLHGSFLLFPPQHGFYGRSHMA